MRRSIAAGALLLAVYVALSFATSPRGFLGTDTGGKVATLRAMHACRCADPDLGYWAERWDPDGSLHPLYYTSRVGGRWVNVTTLPMPLAARPLWAVGGYRAALLLPMLGAVAAAFAAAALVRRLGRGSAAGAFWIVGLASPAVVYALDLWEHAIGLGLLAWAMVWALDLAGRPAGSGAGGVAAAGTGLLFGLAATMRQEAYVYAVVAAVAVALQLAARRRPIALPALAAAVAFAVPVAANEALERAVIGTGVRGTRAGIAALGAGDEPASRAVEGAYTLVALEGSDRGVVLGACAVALLAVAARRVRGRRPDPDGARAAADADTGHDVGPRPTEPGHEDPGDGGPGRGDGPGQGDAGPGDERFALAAVAGAAVLFVTRFAAGGLGFVPGLFVAWPLAVSGAVGARRAVALPVAIALGALPVVLAVQFRGGAAPQWAGRYVLTSGFLLTVAAVATGHRRVVAATAALAAAVTASGVAWLAVRSHDVERAIAAIERRAEPVVVSQVAHLAREGGATYGERRWLTAVTPEALREAAAVVAASGEARFVLVRHALAGPPDAGDLPGWRLGRPAVTPLFDGVDLVLTPVDRTPVRH